MPWYIILLLVVGCLAVRLNLLWYAFMIGEGSVVYRFMKCPPEEREELTTSYVDALRNP
jgi:hypothetical protein